MDKKITENGVELGKSISRLELLTVLNSLIGFMVKADKPAEYKLGVLYAAEFIQKTMIDE